MSEIKVNSIKGVGASAAAITVNNTDGTCTANLTNRTNKNLILNGAFLISQRGTSSTANGYGSVDRFRVQHSATDEAPTQSQVDVASGTTPYSLGFRKAFRITNGNQTSGAGTGDKIKYEHYLEVQDIANSGWNYTSASSFITLSYWIKSSVAQNFYGVVRTRQGTSYSYAYETGSLSANTWTKVTKTFPGNANLQFDNDTAKNFQTDIYAFMGSDLTGSKTLNEWSAYSSSNQTPDQTSTWYTTNDATLEITGVQLEVGSVATDFEHRSFGQELQLCKRYFQKMGGSADHYFFGISRGENATARTGLFIPVPMRAAPTVVCGNHRAFKDGVNSSSTSTPSLYAPSDWVSESSMYTVDFPGHSVSHNLIYHMMSNGTSSTALTLSSEL